MESRSPYFRVEAERVTINTLLALNIVQINKIVDRGIVVPIYPKHLNKLFGEVNVQQT